MANEVEDYVSQPEPESSAIRDIYSMARRIVPGAVDGVSYGMPAILYNGKGLLAVMSTRNHIGIYPFGSLDDFADLAADAALETTKGSIQSPGRNGNKAPDSMNKNPAMTGTSGPVPLSSVAGFRKLWREPAAATTCTMLQCLVSGIVVS